MGQPASIKINQLSSFSGRPIPGSDYLAGLMLYGTTPGTGNWKTYAGTPSISAVQMFSPYDIAVNGILPFTDNVAAIANISVTTPGTTGDVLNIFCNTITKGGIVVKVQICNYISIGGLSDTTEAAAIVALINANTSITGFSATSPTSPEILISAPKNQGMYLNTGSPFTETTPSGGPLAVGAFTQPSGGTLGTASPMSIWDYHINEFFRRFPQGNLWVGLISATSSYNEIVTLQTVAAKNSLRQIGIQDIVAITSVGNNLQGILNKVQTAQNVCQNNAPFVVVYSPNLTSVTSLAVLPNNNNLTSEVVQVVISEDGLGEGNLLHIVNGISVGNVGVKLATICNTSVDSDDGQTIDSNNISDGVENNTPAFSNNTTGSLLSTIAHNLLTQLTLNNYTYFTTINQDLAGSYWNDNATATSSASDYAYINDNRVFQKISRISYLAYLPELKGKLIYNPDGSISNLTIAHLNNVGTNAINAGMVIGYGSTPQLSGFSCSVPVSQTNATINAVGLVVNINYIENGIARQITINVSPVLTLQ